MGDDYKYLLTLRDFQKLFGAGDQKDVPEIETIRLSSNQQGVSPEVVREFLKARGVSYDFQVFIHANLKGGVGKTTSAISFATRAAQYGFKCCILDMDPQGSASFALDCWPEDGEPIFYDIWQRPEEFLEGALKYVQPNLAILPSSLENSLLDTTLLNPATQKKAVENICKQLRKLEYDLVIVDCPPSLGAATISAICAADTIVIPISNDTFSFKGLTLSLAEIDSICGVFQLPMPKIKVLFARYDKRESVSAEAIQRLEEEFGDYLLPVHIRTSTKFSKALSRHETVFASGAKNNARKDYDMLTRSLLNIKT